MAHMYVIGMWASEGGMEWASAGCWEAGDPLHVKLCCNFLDRHGSDECWVVYEVGSGVAKITSWRAVKYPYTPDHLAKCGFVMYLFKIIFNFAISLLNQ